MQSRGEGVSGEDGPQLRLLESDPALLILRPCGPRSNTGSLAYRERSYKAGLLCVSWRQTLSLCKRKVMGG